MERVTIYRSNTIRCKKDAEKFLNSFRGEIYITVPGNDMCIYRRGDQTDVSIRPLRERGNIFSPYLVLDDPVEAIYKNRKYVNDQLMRDRY